MNDLYVRWGRSKAEEEIVSPDQVSDQPLDNTPSVSGSKRARSVRTDEEQEQPREKEDQRQPGAKEEQGRLRAKEEQRQPGTKDDQNQSRAILAGCCVDQSPEKHARAMSELKGLADACGLTVASIVVQNAAQITHATYIGSGKVSELKREIEEYDADIVIFNEALTPMQMRNLEKELDTEVLDRTGLILQIFASRARTREAKLQVESARLQYMLPRLVGMRASLSRQGGGSGRLSNKGAGEQKLELDRRRIEKRIAELRRELEVVERERMTQRNRRLRTGLTKVALVGYTNAGKSTVMNALLNYCDSKGMYGTVTMTGAESGLRTDSGRSGSPDVYGNPSAAAIQSQACSDGENSRHVFEADMLFATLDTSVRRIDAPGHIPFLLSDTVGFVSEVPHALVKAFRSTLDEVRYADLLLEVVDFSDPDYREQIEVTAKTLEEIGAGNIPVVYLYNKTDLAMAAEAVMPETEISGQAVMSVTEAAVQEDSAEIKTETKTETKKYSQKSMPYSADGSDESTPEKYHTANREHTQSCFPGAKSRPIPVKIPFRRGETLYLAAGKGIGIPDILSLIDSALEEDRVECSFLVPYTKGGVLQEMRRFGVLLSEKYLPEGTEVRVRCRRGDARRFQTMLKT